MAVQTGPRRPSVGELEELPSDWTSQNLSLLRRIHEFVYPPNSQWYWYRRGKVSHTALGPKYYKLMLGMFGMALCTSGLFFPMVLIAFSAYLRTMHGINSKGVLDVSVDNLNFTQIAEGDVEWRQLASQPWFIILQCLLSGIVTCATYIANGEYLIKTFYTDRKDVSEEWKCQPNRYPSPDRWREEKILGSVNSFVAGVYGTGLYFLHLNRPFLKFYYDATPLGFGKMFFSMVVCYLWIDLYSYWVHRFHHTPFMYKHVHKWHHRYTAPTPYSAFALHPVEFLLLQSAGIFQTAIMPMHIMGYLCVVLFIAYHNQLDHSGIAFEGDLPWMPGTKYHDDHHQYFHLNFGLHLVFWDWLGGTLRSKKRIYSEERFVGQQDAKDKQETSTAQNTESAASDKKEQ